MGLRSRLARVGRIARVAGTTAALGVLLGNAALTARLYAQDVASGAGPSSPANAAPPADSAARPLFTRQLNFSIPYSVSKQMTDVVAVQLLVSGDRGTTWQLYDQRPPTLDKFEFRARHDGEYWFSSRTQDRMGRVRPDGQPPVQLRMIVDTTAPRLALTANTTAAGEIVARWEILDPHVDPQSFRLFTSGAGESFQPVAVEVPQAGAAPGAVQGSVTFWPPGNSRNIVLRADVRDSADNLTTVEKRIVLPARPSSAPFFPNTPKPAFGQSRPATFPYGSGVPGAAPAGTSYGPGATYSPNAPTPFAAGAPNTGISGAGSSAGAGESTANPAAVAGVAPPTARTARGWTTGYPGAGDSRGPDSPTATAERLGGDLPGGERPRMTSSKKFSLAYDIDSAGPGGVAAVELWITRDRGVSWNRMMQDADRQSPIDVEVDGEGMYGFRIVIVSNSGLTSGTPRAGDLADLWIGVDTTAPKVQMTSVSFAEGEHAGQLDIRWEAEDLRCGPRPVTLSYSDNRDGPWTPFASGLPNNGQYYWTIVGNVPPRVLLRVEVRDEAGNVGHYQLAEPINLQGLNPAGRIRGFQP